MQSRNRALFIIFLTVFLDLIGFGIVIPLLPRYAESFHAGGLGIGLVAAGYSLMQFLCSPLWGRLSDRIGRRPVLLACLGGFVASYLLLGFANSLLMLFVARLLAGACGGNIAAAQAAIADITPPEKRAQGMGLIGMAFGLGFILGPALGGLLVGSDPGHPRFALTGLAAAGMSLAAFLLALVMLPETRTAESRTAARPGFSLAALRHSLGRPNLAVLYLLFFLLFFAFSNMEATFALFLEHRFGLGARAAAGYFVLIGVIVSIMQGGLARVLSPRFGERPVIRAGLFLMAAGLLGMALAPNPLWEALAVSLVAMGNGMNGPALLSFTSRCAPVDEQGGVLGVAQGMGALGRVFGPLVGSLLFFGVPAEGFRAWLTGHHEGAPHHVGAAFLCGALFMLVAGLLAWRGLKAVPSRE